MRRGRPAPKGRSGKGRAKGSVRRGQLVTTFGPGAVLPLEDEAFMVCGIDRWDVQAPNLHEPRLERQLNVSGFVIPAADGNGRDIPVVRFPRWHACPGCRRLAPHDDFTDANSNDCPDCNRRLIPSRFIVACPRGHVTDFPYSRWVHEGRADGGAAHELRLEARGATASLGDIHISCSCGASRTLGGAFDRFALREITRCLGERPWLTGGPEDCDESVRTLQRGASNVWFSHVRSALSIPPWSQGAHRVLERHWAVLKAVPEAALEATIEGMGLAKTSQFSAGDLAEAVRDRLHRAHDSAALDPLRRQEYDALCRGKPEERHDEQFVAVQADIPPGLGEYLGQVMLVKRLREIRVLDGFSRVIPVERAEDERLAPLFQSDPGWLPAVEVKGEGVFLRFDAATLDRWAERPAVSTRAELLNLRQHGRAAREGWQVEYPLTPKLLLIHTLAHALIEQFSLEAGYPTASLRERLYAEEDEAGLLIYTATTDSAGSLGGVVAQAAPESLEKVFREALMRASWCSADPVCIESDGQGVDGLNLAACHACALLPETSCEHYNVLLDRAFLVGRPDEPELGFFSGLLDD